MMSAELPVFTVGHSTRSIQEFAGLLGCGSIHLVVDVRTVPRSRRNPQYNEAVLPLELGRYALAYRRMADLGGLRGRSADIPPRVNGLWENQSFHNYADYALSVPFEAALDDLLCLSSTMRCAIMCAEAVWWRCHRRIIADYLIARGRSVFHLMGSDRIEPARLTRGAQARDGSVFYPATDV